MIDSLTRDDLRTLAERRGNCLVSLYLPTERAGRQVRQNRIRFKNLLDQANQVVTGNDEDANRVRQPIESLRSWERDDGWWQSQAKGLGVFLDGVDVRRWRLPAVVPDLCVCTDKLHIRPLCRVLQNNARFFVLAVSQNDVRLFQGTKASVTELPSAHLPDDLRSALNIDEYVSSLQHHATARGARGDAMFHGQGGSDPDIRKRDEIRQYLRQVNRALHGHLRETKAPLVFAGVDYLFPIFRQVCDYPMLLPEFIVGNPEDMSGKELHQRAWPLIASRLDARCRELVAEYSVAITERMGSGEIDVILPAAEQGRVATLLTAADAYLWESVPPAVGTSDLINSAVVATLRNGGQVFSVDNQQIDGKIAAIFRYPSGKTSNAND